MRALNQLYEDAEYWFRAAELDVLNGTYFNTDPTKEKVPDSIRIRNRRVVKENFISAKMKIVNLKNKYLTTLKPIVFDITRGERKKLMAMRYKFEKLIKSCDHYIELHS